jgi:hypothetical protein
MSIQYTNEDDFINETLAQWQRIGGRFFADIPSFVKTWNHVLENQEPQHVSPLHPIAQLVEYLQALTDACQQALYAIERITLYCDKENSNTFGFFVSHYVYDFFSRIKSATDLLALMIRHIYEISNTELKDEACALEKGLVASILRKSAIADPTRESLAKKLDKARNWVKPLYDLRNVIIHKPGLDFPPLGAIDNSSWRHGIYISIHCPYLNTPSSITFDRRHPLNALKPLAVQGEPFSVFLREIKSKAVHSHYNLYVEPVTLCEEVWALLSSLIEDIIKECHPQIVTFVSKNKQP